MNNTNPLVTIQEQTTPATESTKRLTALLQDRPDVRELLERSLEQAAKTNPDPETNPVQTLEAYVGFVDRIVRLIPKDVLENPSLALRDQMLQGMCYFHFLVNQPLPELEGKGQYNNTLQYYSPFSTWLGEFVDSWGAFLDTEASWNWDIYREFHAEPQFGLQKEWYEPAANWNTFNEFFARYLRSPAVRPIADPADPTVVTSPADSVPQGVWKIDDNSRITTDHQDGISVKSTRYYSVDDLLGPDSQYHGAFANGTLTHTLLNVNDYHRFHLPVTGTIKDVTQISGNVAVEVTWDEQARRYRYTVSPGWQFTQTRGSVVVETEYGLVALIPIGMGPVSSVVFEDTITEGASMSKGDMLGCFLFGGSDFIMLFQQHTGFEATVPIGDHHKMGEQYGVLTDRP